MKGHSGMLSLVSLHAKLNFKVEKSSRQPPVVSNTP